MRCLSCQKIFWTFARHSPAVIRASLILPPNEADGLHHRRLDSVFPPIDSTLTAPSFSASLKPPCFFLLLWSSMLFFAPSSPFLSLLLSPCDSWADSLLASCNLIGWVFFKLPCSFNTLTSHSCTAAMQFLCCTISFYHLPPIPVTDCV